MENENRLLSDPYLSAYLFLKLKIRPKPIVDNQGRVNFSFENSEDVQKAVDDYYAGDTISAFTFASAVKATKTIIYNTRNFRK